jgi:transposase InsO family protein
VEDLLRNHAPDIAAMDLFVVPTIGFKLLYGFVIVRIDRRDLVWINVTTNPTAEWIARQLTEAFPWDGAPGYMIRGRDRIYGAVVTRRLRPMGIRDKPIAAASPWQNGFAERLIGSIRRECLDLIIVSGEAHLRRRFVFDLRDSTFARPHPSLDAVQTGNASPNIAVSRPKLRPIVTRIVAENVGAEGGPHWPNSTGGTNGKPDDDIRVSSLR